VVTRKAPSFTVSARLLIGPAQLRSVTSPAPHERSAERTNLRNGPRTGRPPQRSDAELLTLAVAQVLLGMRPEARWLRFVPRALPGAFPYLPGQSGYNERLRVALPLIKRLIRVLATDTDQ
jgi:hypothetical protein